jgi:hypothetical protein
MLRQPMLSTPDAIVLSHAGAQKATGSGHDRSSERGLISPGWIL